MSGGEDLTARIIGLYRDEGMTLEAVAAATGFGRQVIRRVLREAGVQMRGTGRRRVPVSAEQAAAIAAARDAGGVEYAIVASGLGRTVVRRVLAEHDAGLRALRWAWEGLYQISEGDGLEAWRIDGTGSVSAATVEGLRDAVREDWPKYALGVRL